MPSPLKKSHRPSSRACYKAIERKKIFRRAKRAIRVDLADERGTWKFYFCTRSLISNILCKFAELKTLFRKEKDELTFIVK